jgi:hypothetical protein
MVSINRALKRQALVNTVREFPRSFWWSLKEVARNFTIQRWRLHYERELYDLQQDAYELEAKDFEFEEIPF